jgi:uncharacterized protein
MNLRFYDFESLEKELEGLPTLHRIAFAAACCERLLPNYNAFAREESWGAPSLLRAALDEVWQILEGKPVDIATLKKLRNACDSDDIVPHSDDFCGYVAEAQEAAIAIYKTLDACIEEQTLQHVIEAAERVAFTIEFSTDWDVLIETEEYIETVARHPFTVREMAKQNEILERLKSTKELNHDFLEWLRTSFDNDGKSLIDLG